MPGFEQVMGFTSLLQREHLVDVHLHVTVFYELGNLVEVKHVWPGPHTVRFYAHGFRSTDNFVCRHGRHGNQHAGI